MSWWLHNNVVLFVLNEILTLKQMWLFDCTVCYRVVAYLYFMFCFLAILRIFDFIICIMYAHCKRPPDLYIAFK